ncbi:His Kinase A (Phosphoacceptor) domain containing protein [Balamuthia mandrillaris]
MDKDRWSQLQLQPDVGWLQRVDWLLGLMLPEALRKDAMERRHKASLFLCINVAFFLASLLLLCSFTIIAPFSFSWWSCLDIQLTYILFNGHQPQGWIVFEPALLMYMRYSANLGACVWIVSLFLNVNIFVACAWNEGNGLCSPSFLFIFTFPMFNIFVQGIRTGLTSLFIVIVEGALLELFACLDPSSTGCPSFFEGATRLLVLLTICVVSIVFEASRQNVVALPSVLQKMNEALKEKDQANKQLQEATTAKTLFLANMSHELRTPMHGIVAMSEELLELSSLDERAQECAHIVADCADHLFSLLTDILDFSRVESGKMIFERNIFSLKKEAKKVIKMLSMMAAKKAIVIQCNISLRLPHSNKHQNKTTFEDNIILDYNNSSSCESSNNNDEESSIETTNSERHLSPSFPHAAIPIIRTKHNDDNRATKPRRHSSTSASLMSSSYRERRPNRRRHYPRPRRSQSSDALNEAEDETSCLLRMGDAVRLRQVLFNLLSNAIKFSHRGGKIIVNMTSPPSPSSSQNQKDKDEENEEDHEDDRILVEVIDEGIGIAEEHLGGLFDSFTQADASTCRKFGGSGLGLAICKKICEAMGGSIGVESSLGEGSTFSFTLPLPLADTDELLCFFNKRRARRQRIREERMMKKKKRAAEGAADDEERQRDSNSCSSSCSSYSSTSSTTNSGEDSDYGNEDEDDEDADRRANEEDQLAQRKGHHKDKAEEACCLKIHPEQSDDVAFPVPSPTLDERKKNNCNKQKPRTGRKRFRRSLPLEVENSTTTTFNHPKLTINNDNNDFGSWLKDRPRNLIRRRSVAACCFAPSSYSSLSSSSTNPSLPLASSSLSPLCLTSSSSPSSSSSTSSYSTSFWNLFSSTVSSPGVSSQSSTIEQKRKHFSLSSSSSPSYPLPPHPQWLKDVQHLEEQEYQNNADENAPLQEIQMDANADENEDDDTYDPATELELEETSESESETEASHLMELPTEHTVQKKTNQDDDDNSIDDEQQPQQQAIESLSPSFSSPTEETDQNEKSLLRGRKILVVEDNLINQRVAQRLLSMLDCSATIAGNGVEALRLLDQHSFDLILMDCHMPLMDGFETTKAIRAKEMEAEAKEDKKEAKEERRRSFVPIIALTAATSVDSHRKCLESGMNDCLMKPVRKTTLVEALQPERSGGGGGDDEGDEGEDLWQDIAGGIPKEVLQDFASLLERAEADPAFALLPEPCPRPEVSLSQTTNRTTSRTKLDQQQQHLGGVRTTIPIAEDPSFFLQLHLRLERWEEVVLSVEHGSPATFSCFWWTLQHNKEAQEAIGGRISIQEGAELNGFIVKQLNRFFTKVEASRVIERPKVPKPKHGNCYYDPLQQFRQSSSQLDILAFHQRVCIEAPPPPPQRRTRRQQQNKQEEDEKQQGKQKKPAVVVGHEEEEEETEEGFQIIRVPSSSSSPENESNNGNENVNNTKAEKVKEAEESDIPSSSSFGHKRSRGENGTFGNSSTATGPSTLDIATLLDYANQELRGAPMTIEDDISPYCFYAFLGMGHLFTLKPCRPLRIIYEDISNRFDMPFGPQPYHHLAYQNLALVKFLLQANDLRLARVPFIVVGRNESLDYCLRQQLNTAACRRAGIDWHAIHVLYEDVREVEYNRALVARLNNVDLGSLTTVKRNYDPWSQIPPNTAFIFPNASPIITKVITFSMLHVFLIEGEGLEYIDKVQSDDGRIEVPIHLHVNTLGFFFLPFDTYVDRDERWRFTHFDERKRHKEIREVRPIRGCHQGCLIFGVHLRWISGVRCGEEELGESCRRLSSSLLLLPFIPDHPEQLRVSSVFPCGYDSYPGYKVFHFP